MTIDRDNNTSEKFQVGFWFGLGKILPTDFIKIFDPFCFSKAWERHSKIPLESSKQERNINKILSYFLYKGTPKFEGHPI